MLDLQLHPIITDCVPIVFSYLEEKAVAAARLLLLLEDKSVDITRLIKLLYLCERESLLQRNNPIFGDSYKSLPFGPAVQVTYSKLQASWGGLLRHGHLVILKEDRGIAALSKKQVNLITQVSENFLSLEDWQLTDYCYKLPEYQYSKDSILVRELLKFLGKTPEEIESIAQEAKRDQHIRDCFKSHHILSVPTI